MNNSFFIPVSYSKKRKYKKGYYIIHFYFKLDYLCWWSIHYKVRGNKRFRPEKLIMREPRKEEINYYPYELNETDTKVMIPFERYTELMAEIMSREQARKERQV